VYTNFNAGKLDLYDTYTSSSSDRHHDVYALPSLEKSKRPEFMLGVNAVTAINTLSSPSTSLVL
jgi:hypothetical protein